MIQFLTVIGGLAILAAIFLRRYFMVEKGVGIRAFFFRPFRPRGAFFRRPRDVDLFEVTADEVLPPPESVDRKKAARAAILLKKAETQLNRGELKAAEKTFIQAIALNPSLVEAYNKLGLIYLRNAQFGKAESIFRKLILAVTAEPTYFSNLGMALYSQQQFGEAKIYYKRAIELDETRAGRFFSLGQIYKELGEVDSALEHLQKAVQMEPRNPDYMLSLAQFYLERQMPTEARELLNEILLVFPDNEAALEMLKVC